MKTRSSPRTRQSAGIFCLAAFGAAALATSFSQAQQIDLSDTSIFGGEINDALYRIDTSQPAGTGIFTRDNRGVFLTIQADGTEEGYNSNAPNIMDTKRVDQWNHPVLFSDLTTVTIDGTVYVPFLLDINESMGGDRSKLVLDDVKIFTSTDPALDDGSLDDLLVNPANTLRYSLDAGTSDPNSWVLLDYARSSAGSGRADMGLFVPLDNFADTALTDAVYLYSHFGADVAGAGSDGSSTAGFEEWTLGLGGVIVVPESSTALLVALGCLGASLRRRRA